MSGVVFSVFATVLGSIIGSFLNACIHRLPRGLSLDHPRRSFCPSCNRSIPWYENLPVISWLALRGKCAGCGSKISIRYLCVEVLTAAMFLLCWQRYGLPLSPIYWVFLALLITATFIDIEHFIIPDEITWGGTVAGIIFSAIVPQLMQTDSRLQALGFAVLGAGIGFGLLWLIVELGKLAFGRKRHAFSEPEVFQWNREGENITLTVGEESLPWEEIFSRHSDQLVLECKGLEFQGRTLEATVLRFHYNSLKLEQETFPLEELSSFSGKLTAVVIPREAMGFGDVKFIAAIGAFLGWKAVLFTIASASVIGCVAAVAGIFIARDRAGARVPFGPFLALGAVIWMFGGQALWEWYFNMVGIRNF